jgi:hypothetical protein
MILKEKVTSSPSNPPNQPTANSTSRQAGKARTAHVSLTLLLTVLSSNLVNTLANEKRM